MIKFAEIVKTKISSCTKCVSILYALPCQIDASIEKCLVSFGVSAYPLNSINFLRIDSCDGFRIEARLKSKVIKFIMPKKFENSDFKKLKRKVEFENSLKRWMEDKLKIKIVKEA